MPTRHLGGKGLARGRRSVSLVHRGPDIRKEDYYVQPRFQQCDSNQEEIMFIEVPGGE